MGLEWIDTDTTRETQSPVLPDGVQVRFSYDLLSFFFRGHAVKLFNQRIIIGIIVPGHVSGTLGIAEVKRCPGSIHHPTEKCLDHGLVFEFFNEGLKELTSMITSEAVTDVKEAVTEVKDNVKEAAKDKLKEVINQDKAE